MSIILGLCIVVIIAIILFIKVKNKIVRYITGFISVIGILLLVMLCTLYYIMNIRVTLEAKSLSPNKDYKVELKSIGQPIFFSKAEGKVVLEKGNKTISEYEFNLYDDGGSIREDIWKVTWKKDHAEIVISGDEQNDQQINLYFNGKKSTQTLKTKFGKTLEERQKEAAAKQQANQNVIGAGEVVSKQDQAEKEKSKKITAQYTKELKAIAKTLNINTDIKVEYDAKGQAYAILSKKKSTKGSDVKRFNYYPQNSTDKKHEYVLEEISYDKKGKEISTKVVNFYLVNVNTLKVTDEKTNKWH